MEQGRIRRQPVAAGRSDGRTGGRTHRPAQSQYQGNGRDCSRRDHRSCRRQIYSRHGTEHGGLAADDKPKREKGSTCDFSFCRTAEPRQHPLPRQHTQCQGDRPVYSLRGWPIQLGALVRLPRIPLRGDHRTGRKAGVAKLHRQGHLRPNGNDRKFRDKQ